MNIIQPSALAIITIWMEAEGECFEGKCAVGEVIRNRMKRFYSSDGSIPGTVARRFQFSGWNDDKTNNARLILALKLDDSSVIAMQCVDAWRQSATTNYTKEAVLYLNKALVDPLPSWALSENEVATIGSHTFFSA